LFLEEDRLIGCHLISPGLSSNPKCGSVCVFIG